MVLGICILANGFTERFQRIDLTQDGLHTLDIKVRELVWNLDKPLYAKVFFSRDIEGQHRNNETVLLDKLEELRAYSQGMLIIERIDPSSNPDLEKLAQGFGIEPTTIFHKDQRKTTLKKAYMGLALIYGDRQETLPPIQNLQAIEYDLAKALRRLRASDSARSVLAFSTGHGEIDIINGSQPPLQKLTAELRENHEVRSIALGGETEVPNDVDVLWVVGPQKPMSRAALIQLDQFLMRGGSLGVFPSGIKPDVRDYRSHKTVLIQHGLDAFLAHFGVTLNKDLLADRKNNETMDYTSLIGYRADKRPILRRAQINHPLMVSVKNLNETSIVNRGIQSLVFPFSSTLSLNEPLQPDVEAMTLATTAESSGRLIGVQTFKLESYKVVNPGERTGAFPVLFSLSGRWPSFFSDDPLPEVDAAARLNESAPARLVVSGSSSFVYNNPQWMLNLADWMSQDEDLISIRSKLTSPPEMRELTPQEISFFKHFNMFSGTAIIWLVGLLVWIIKRRVSAKGRAHEA